MKGQKGFTLIELLIVIAVLGVLAAVAVPNVSGFLTAGRVQAANTEAANVETAAQAYYGSTGAYPANSSSLDSDYIAGTLKAQYGFDSNGQINDVTTGGLDPNWVGDGIVYSLSGNKWIKGDPAGGEDNDADKP